MTTTKTTQEQERKRALWREQAKRSRAKKRTMLRGEAAVQPAALPVDRATVAGVLASTLAKLERDIVAKAQAAPGSDRARFYEAAALVSQAAMKLGAA